MTTQARLAGMVITAQDLYNYTRCAHRVYLDAHGAAEERSEVSAFVRLLWEMGLQTEQDYIRALGDLPLQDLRGLSIDAVCARTQALVAEGAPLIFQGGIRMGHWLGRPDLLVKRTDATSRLGDYYYEPIEIKAGHGWEERAGKRKRFKEHYAFQVLFYRRILQAIQGYVPARARIINVDMEIEEFDPAEFEHAFAQALAEVERLVAGAETSEPVLGSVCHHCHWYRRCRRWVEGTGDPSLLYYVGKAKFDLKRVGLKHIRDIAAMNIDDYVDGSNKIPRMGRANLGRIKERARVMLAGQPAIRLGYELPRKRREIYFDIEDDPTRGVIYLFGLIVREGDDIGEFRHFLARTPAEEERVVREFWQYLASVEDAVFYVYSSKERSTLRRLMQRYALDESVFNRYVEQEYDLYTDLVVKHSDWPTYSYGIKQIARSVGFSWRDPDPGGANSIVWYNAYVNDPAREDLLERILAYNEDDCRAMIAVKDYFARCARSDEPRR